MTKAVLPKILCVDDEPGLLRSMRWLMRGRYEVAVAACGRDALALLGGDSFDVMICNQRMPGMSGTELLEHARLVSPRTVRMLLTGHADLDAVLGSLNDGEVFRYLAKPWDNQQLLTSVADAVAIAQGTAGASTTTTQNRQVNGAGTWTATVLVFSDDAGVTAPWRAAARDAFNVLCTDDIADALGHLARRNVDVLVTELDDACSQRVELIRAVHRHLPSVAVVVHDQENAGGAVEPLIDEGLVHRCIGGPASPDQCHRVLRTAMNRHQEAIRPPDSAAPSAWLLGLLS